MNPQDHPQVGRTFTGKYAILELLAELHDLRAENKKLRRRVTALEKSKARWKNEAHEWKWSYLGWRRTRYV